ncbi:MAG: DoxX family membrane protein [Terracidiphilus sp.]
MPCIVAAFLFPFAAHLSSIPALAAFFAIPPIVLATYGAGLAILVAGLIVAFRGEIPRARGLDKIVCLGPVLYAVPLAVFGAEQLAAARGIATMVPHWIPWHIFWAIFVGMALIAAAVSLALQRVAALASALVGLMFFLFVVLMDVEGLAAAPTNRFAQVLTLRELTFSACAFTLASTLATSRWRSAAHRLATAARYVVGVVVIFYGVEQFLHPQFVPVIPLELHMPAYIPFHPLWAYGVGAAEVAAGVTMLANWRARLAATLLGIVICVVTVLVYGPILAAHPGNIDVGMNYFADTLFFGGDILLLAGSIPPGGRERSATQQGAAGRLAVLGGSDPKAEATPRRRGVERFGQRTRIDS